MGEIIKSQRGNQEAIKKGLEQISFMISERKKDEEFVLEPEFRVMKMSHATLLKKFKDTLRYF